MVGRTVSHYRLIEKLGAGGMGDVYRAQDTRLTRAVAIKVLSASHAGNSERRRRFLQEAQAASALNHPNIITIHDVVVEAETEFIVMEFVAGKTLGDLIAPGGLAVAEVVGYAVQIADALSAAHAAGIVHRDLKPPNVMVTQSGLVKILDFGLAKLSAHATTLAGLGDDTATLAASPLTVEGSIMGTVSYMSPEQAQGRTVDARSDVFSFGVVVYEMVTGRRAFAGETTLSTLSSILRDEVRPFSETTANVPPLLDHIVRKCLSKNPAERWQSMQEVRAALVALQRDSDSLAPVPLPVKRRSLSPLVLAAAGAGLLAAVGGWWTIGHRRPAQPVESPAPVPTPAPSVSASSVDGDVLTNDGIVAMVRAKVAPSIILQQIRFSQTRFDFSTSEIIRLTGAGVSAEILDAMRNPKRPPAVASKPAAKTPAVEAPSVNALSANTPTTSTPAIERPATEKPATQPAAQSIAVPDGLPFSIRLAEDVPSDAEPGRPLRFVAVRDFRIGETTVVAANAAVTGEIVDGAKKKLLGGAKMTFRLKDVAAVDGSKLSVRAMPSRRGSDGRRPVEGASLGKHPKEIAAPAGTGFIAYIEGGQTVTIRK